MFLLVSDCECDVHTINKKLLRLRNGIRVCCQVRCSCEQEKLRKNTMAWTCSAPRLGVGGLLFAFKMYIFNSSKYLGFDGNFLTSNIHRALTRRDQRRLRTTHLHRSSNENGERHNRTTNIVVHRHKKQTHDSLSAHSHIKIGFNL